jgi:two-component system response regulator HydG
MVVLATDDTLTLDQLPPEIRPSTAMATDGMDNLVGISLERAEKELIRNTLKRVEGNREQAAKILGIGERTLYRKIKEYGL